MNALIRVGANTIHAIMGAATPARHIVEDALRRSSGDVGTALNLLLDAQPEEVFSPPPPPPSFSPYAAPAADHAAATAGASGAHAANAIDLDDIDDSMPAVRVPPLVACSAPPAAAPSPAPITSTSAGTGSAAAARWWQPCLRLGLRLSLRLGLRFGLRLRVR
jgi:hypothetical protein